MRYVLVASLFMGVANASPFYFQTTIGGAGSFDRGLDNTTGGIALGVTVYETDRFGIDLEAGYTHIGTVKAKPVVEHTVWYEPQPIVVPVAPRKPPDVVVDPPIVKPEPIIEPPVVVVEPPEEPPIYIAEPDKAIGPPDQGHIDDQQAPEEPPIVVIDLPILPVLASTPQSVKAGNVRINGQELKKYLPKFSTDLYQLTAGARVKIGNFLWINLRGGAEKKVIDGQIEEKSQKGQLINWRTDEKFRDNELTYLLGGSVLFPIRKQLMGIVKFDYHDHNNQVDDSKFQTDDIIVSVGLRFGL